MGRRPFKWQFAFRRRFWVNRCFFPTHCQIDQQIIVNWLEHAHIIIIRFRIDFLLILRFLVFLFKFMTSVWWVICSCHFDSIGLDWLSTLSFLSVAVAVSVISIGLLSFCHLQLRFFFIFYFELSSISLLCCSLSASLSLSDPFAVVDKPVLYHWFGSYARLSDMWTCCIDILINAHHWTMKLRC